MFINVSGKYCLSPFAQPPELRCLEFLIGGSTGLLPALLPAMVRLSNPGVNLIRAQPEYQGSKYEQKRKDYR